MTTFPTLRLGVLTALVELKGAIDANPTILRSPECPYDKETVAALEAIFRERVVEKIVEKLVKEEVARPVGRPVKDQKLSAEGEQEVETTMLELLEQLKKMGEGETGLDTQTKLTIIKTKASMMEQLVKLRERWFNVKRVSVFQAVVIGILDDLVGEDGRDEFLARVEPYRE